MLLISVITLVLYIPLSNISESRGRDISIESLNNEGRALEFIYYPVVVLNEKNPVLFLFIGRDLFNSQNKFFDLNQNVGEFGGRFLHSDYAHLLYGSGIIGLLIYISIFVSILLRANKFLKVRHDLRYLAIGSIIIVVCILAGGLGDGILSLPNRLLPMYLLGVFMSYLHSENPLSIELRIKN